MPTGWLSLLPRSASCPPLGRRRRRGPRLAGAMLVGSLRGGVVWPGREMKDVQCMAEDSRADPAPLSPSDGRWSWLSIADGDGLLLPLGACCRWWRLAGPSGTTSPTLRPRSCSPAVVVGVAAFGNRRAGWIASVSSCVWFDFFLTRPYERFSISAAHDIETTVALARRRASPSPRSPCAAARHFAVAMAEGNYPRPHPRRVRVRGTRGIRRRRSSRRFARSSLELLDLQGCRFEARATVRAGARSCCATARWSLARIVSTCSGTGCRSARSSLVVQSKDHRSTALRHGRRRGRSPPSRSSSVSWPSCSPMRSAPPWPPASG